jgi:hypothetical protein
LTEVSWGLHTVSLALPFLALVLGPPRPHSPGAIPSESAQSLSKPMTPETGDLLEACGVTEELWVVDCLGRGLHLLPRLRILVLLHRSRQPVSSDLN